MKMRIEKLVKSNITVAVLINLIALAAVFIFCDFKYEVSDDFIMSAIMSGAFGETYNPKMIFVNVIWGYILLPFYKLVPIVSWYFVAQIGLIFVSSVIVAYFLLERLEKPKAYLLITIWILFFVNDAYILVQFTKTAMLAIMSGSILFLRGVFEEKWIKTIIGGIVCLAGTMLRFSDVYMAGGFILLILFYEFTDIAIKWKKESVTWKYLLKIAAAGSVLIAFAFGLKAFDTYIYQRNEEYQYFQKYNAARAGIVDSADMEYEECREELEKIGVSENDYLMMKYWIFADPNYFTLEKMQQVSDIVRNHQQNQHNTVEEIFQSIQRRLFPGYAVFHACAILLILGMFLNTSRWWMALGSWGVGIFYLIYFSIRERWVYRTEYAVFAGIFLCGIYFWRKCNDTEEYIGNKKIKQICTGLILVLFVSKCTVYIPDNSYKNLESEERRDYIENVFYNSWNYDVRKYRRVVNKEKPYNNLLGEIEENKQNYYFLDFATTIQTLYYEYNPFRSLPIGYFDNVNYMAGVTTEFPDVVSSFEKSGVSVPLKDLVKENVYLVDNYYPGLKLTYLQEHYYPNARAELYKVIDGYQIWKIYTQ